MFHYKSHLFRFAIDNLHPSAHLSSTVEMLSTQMRVELAVIDEIQMLRDEQRGWAWTRALLGVAADEVSFYSADFIECRCIYVESQQPSIL